MCEDVIEGESAVKKGSTRYLPKPRGMKESEYRESYLTRAEFFPATGRTLEGLHGLMFSKDVQIEVPEELSEYLENVDGEGTSFGQFTNDVAWESLKTHFGGVLIDAPEASEYTSMRDAEENGIVPYMTYYSAFDVINWDYDRIGRSKKLMFVVLEEREYVDTTDRFTKEEKKRYRLCELDEDGFYRQQVYDEEGVLLSEHYPKKFGENLRYIPFYFLPNTKPYTPLMYNLATVNLAWYRKSADYENGLHWTGVPTPYSIGYEPETITKEDSDGNMVEVPKYPMSLGGSQFLYFPTGTTHVGFLEFTGTGLSQLSNAMEVDEERMAILGARIISAEKKGVESAETARIHRAGENGVLSAFANELSNGLTRLLRDYLEWISGREITDDIAVHINTDYDVSKMSVQELTALVSCWQSGGIPKRILFQNMKEGDIIDGNEDFETVEQEILAEKETQFAQSIQQMKMMNDTNTEGDE